MKEEIKTLWVNALRSGKYKQGKHKLRGDDSFCCFGVLCDVGLKGMWAKDIFYFTPGGKFWINEALTTSLGNTALGILRISASESSYLVGCNDLNNWNFNKIADWVEENL